MEFREIVAGLGFLEGPVVLPDGRLVVVDVKHGTLVSVDVASRQYATLADTKGGPNGAALGPDGALYVCQNGGVGFVSHDGMTAGDLSVAPLSAAAPGIQRVTLDGEVTDLYTECDGRPLVAPNDIVFDAHGGFYFTDIGRSRGRLADLGGLYYAKADGTTIRELVHNPSAHAPLTQPNGVGLSPDGQVVHVAETSHCRVSSWKVDAPGELSPESPHTALGPSGERFDSLAVDIDGNICVATLGAGGITVLSPRGDILEFLKIPTRDTHITNLCFGGPDLAAAYVTASGSGAVWEVSGWRKGLPLNYSS